MVVYCVVVLLVVMEWVAAITGDLVQLFLEFSQRRKILADHFLRGRNGSPVLMLCFCIFLIPKIAKGSKVLHFLFFKVNERQ